MAVKSKPDDDAAWNNWGAALINQANSKTGEEADRLYQEACEKYEMAVKSKLDGDIAWINWGVALVARAKSKAGVEIDRLYQEACDKLTHAESLVPGGATYELACLYALTGREEKCKAYLDACVKHGTLPALDHLENDTDLDGVRDQDWFKQYMP